MSQAKAFAPWTAESVSLSHGTEVRMDYLGRVYHGRIEDGLWVVRDGRNRIHKADSPSTAATLVARTASGAHIKLNGWKHWEARGVGGAWFPLSSMRRDALPGLHFARKPSRRIARAA